MSTNILIVGDHRDAHVTAVTDAVRHLGGSRPMLIDAPSLADRTYHLEGANLSLDGRTISLDDGTRGWLRRYAPTLWGAGTVTGSLDSIRRRAFLALVGSISRVGSPRWLTSVEAMLRAEDRLLQLHVAAELGVPVPRTVVTSDGEQARNSLGDRFVVKPLAAGYYHTEDGAKAVFASMLQADQLDDVDFADAPFVAQEALTAMQHYRVVTVGTRAWTARLSGCDRPLDWRRQEVAHSSWEPAEVPTLASSAVSLCERLGVGFSSQDWIDDGERIVFVDLNPGGQWLFLPDEIAQPATTAIAKFLVGAPDA